MISRFCDSETNFHTRKHAHPQHWMLISMLHSSQWSKPAANEYVLTKLYFLRTACSVWPLAIHAELTSYLNKLCHQNNIFHESVKLKESLCLREEQNKFLYVKKRKCYWVATDFWTMPITRRKFDERVSFHRDSKNYVFDNTRPTQGIALQSFIGLEGGSS